MANPLIAHPRLSDAATLHASSEYPSFPASNLQRKQPGDVWRPQTLTPYVEVDLGQAATITLAALIGLNVSAAATLRIRAAAVQGDLTASPAYDSGAFTFRPSGSDDDWESFVGFAWTGGVNCRWWRFDVADSSNADGYLDFGRLYLSSAQPFAIGMSKGAAIGAADATKKSRSAGGQRYTGAPRRPERYLDFTIGFGSEDEMLGPQFKIDMMRGISKDVLVILDYARSAYVAQRIVYGELATLADIVLPEFRIYQKRYRVEELLP